MIVKITPETIRSVPEVDMSNVTIVRLPRGGFFIKTTDAEIIEDCRLGVTDSTSPREGVSSSSNLLVGTTK